MRVNKRARGYIETNRLYKMLASNLRGNLHIRKADLDLKTSVGDLLKENNNKNNRASKRRRLVEDF